MSASFEKLIGDLSLLLVMVDGSDTMGFEALLEILRQAEAQAKVERASDSRLLGAFAHVREQQRSLDPKAYVPLVQEFISQVQSHLAGNTSAHFPGEQKSSTANTELAEYFDAEFLPDFVAKHTMMLEEFEGSIADYRFQAESTGPEETEKFKKFLKSYLHNLKGDAGSVGLSGIEKATHALGRL